MLRSSFPHNLEANAYSIPSQEFQEQVFTEISDSFPRRFYPHILLHGEHQYPVWLGHNSIIFLNIFLNTKLFNQRQNNPILIIQNKGAHSLAINKIEKVDTAELRKDFKIPQIYYSIQLREKIFKKTLFEKLQPTFEVC